MHLKTTGCDDMGRIHLAQDQVASSCEHDNEPLGSIKDGKFLDGLSDYQPHKDDIAQWR
jgi:hypothetical protein